MRITESARREFDLAKDAFKQIKRDPKYKTHVLGLYALSLASPELGSVARSSYSSMRYVDDILDGDRYDVADPLEHVMRLRGQIESCRFDSKDPKSLLAKGALQILDRRKKPGDDPRQDFLDGIDAMVFDHTRAQTRKELSSDELNDYYDKAFSPVVNIMFVGLKSHLRASDIPELSSTQGRVYSIRDLATDWSRGIINIPSEVLRTARISSSSSYDEVSESPVIKEWIVHELKHNEIDLMMADVKLRHASKERITIKMGGGLIHPMERFIANYGRQPQA